MKNRWFRFVYFEKVLKQPIGKIWQRAEKLIVYLVRGRTKRNRQQWKGSITVEASLVMPIVLACIFLLIIMNYYLHDVVVLNSFTTEAVYGDEKRIDEVQARVNTTTLVLHNTQLSTENGLINKKASWHKKYDLPIKNLLSTILKDTSVNLGGKIEKMKWSMVSIIRIKTALIGGEDSW